jgi:hypothetical protein
LHLLTTESLSFGWIDIEAGKWPPSAKKLLLIGSTGQSIVEGEPLLQFQVLNCARWIPEQVPYTSILRIIIYEAMASSTNHTRLGFSTPKPVLLGTPTAKAEILLMILPPGRNLRDSPTCEHGRAFSQAFLRGTLPLGPRHVFHGGCHAVLHPAYHDSSLLGRVSCPIRPVGPFNLIVEPLSCCDLS